MGGRGQRDGVWFRSEFSQNTRKIQFVLILSFFFFFEKCRNRKKWVCVCAKNGCGSSIVFGILLLWAAGCLCFHPDGWHHIVVRRCLHQKLPPFFVLVQCLRPLVNGEAFGLSTFSF